MSFLFLLSSYSFIYTLIKISKYHMLYNIVIFLEKGRRSLDLRYFLIISFNLSPAGLSSFITSTGMFCTEFSNKLLWYNYVPFYLDFLFLFRWKWFRSALVKIWGFLKFRSFLRFCQKFVCK